MSHCLIPFNIDECRVTNQWNRRGGVRTCPMLHTQDTGVRSLRIADGPDVVHMVGYDNVLD